MSVTADTIARNRAMRAEVDASVTATVAHLTKAWGVAWSEIVDEWAAAIADLVDGDEWPTAAQIARATRAQKALQAAGDALDELSREAGVRILSDISTVTGAAGEWVERIAATQLPDGATAGFARVDAKALDAIVTRSTKAVTAATRPLSRQATAAMKATLIRGVAVGDSPEQAARIMLARSRDGFNGGLARARVIARTEIVDAHRAAATAARDANRDVLRGWRWTTEFSSRTCPACLSMHGTEYGPGEPGPLGHQCCRCAATPITRSWRELGFDIPEPAGIEQETGEQWLARQPETVQKQVLGNGWQAWKAGNWPASQWATRRTSDGWRDSYTTATPPKRPKE